MANRTNRGLEQVRSQAGLDRRLVLEVRRRRFGFVLFEESRLLDWGTGRCTDHGTAARKVRALLLSYSPVIVITRRRRRRFQGGACAHDLRQVRIEIEHRGIKFTSISERRVRSFFARYGHETKQEIAVRLASEFPVLKPVLPKPRKPWNPERHATVIFDAVATDVAYVDKPLSPVEE
jgi:hypothetical protein